MSITALKEELSKTTYPGRGIILGRSEDGKHAVCVYFIMGRSSNSRNRIFVEDGAGIRTEAFDPSKLEDPSLIIYAPVRVLGNATIVTNGDQTDTVYDGLVRGETFEESLRCRKFEPDAPNYTPRISGVVNVQDGSMTYAMSELKSEDGDPDITCRYTWTYEDSKAGLGRFIHTYEGDGNPLPSYSGEPTRVTLPGDIDSLTDTVWNALDADNKVSLFVRYIDLENQNTETRIVNKNQ